MANVTMKSAWPTLLMPIWLHEVIFSLFEVQVPVSTAGAWRCQRCLFTWQLYAGDLPLFSRLHDLHNLPKLLKLFPLAVVAKEQ